MASGGRFEVKKVLFGAPNSHPAGEHEGIALPKGQDLQEYKAVKTEFHRVFGAELRRLLCVECEVQLADRKSVV